MYEVDDEYEELRKDVEELLYIVERHIVGLDPKYYTKELAIDYIRRFNLNYDIVSNVVLSNNTKEQ